MENNSWLLLREPNSKFIPPRSIQRWNSNENDFIVAAEILIDPALIATGHAEWHSSKFNNHWSYQSVLFHFPAAAVLDRLERWTLRTH